MIKKKNVYIIIYITLPTSFLGILKLDFFCFKSSHQEMTLQTALHDQGHLIARCPSARLTGDNLLPNKNGSSCQLLKDGHPQTGHPQLWKKDPTKFVKKVLDFCFFRCFPYDSHDNHYENFMWHYQGLYLRCTSTHLCCHHGATFFNQFCFLPFCRMENLLNCPPAPNKKCQKLEHLNMSCHLW